MRVDRREVSFKVEPNPEKKTAADVAKLINDPRFKTNVFRRFGVTLVRAGVGDKVKNFYFHKHLYVTGKILSSFIVHDLLLCCMCLSSLRLLLSSLGILRVCC